MDWSQGVPHSFSNLSPFLDSDDDFGLPDSRGIMVYETSLAPRTNEGYIHDINRAVIPNALTIPSSLYSPSQELIGLPVSTQVCIPAVASSQIFSLRLGFQPTPCNPKDLHGETAEIRPMINDFRNDPLPLERRRSTIITIPSGPREATVTALPYFAESVGSKMYSSLWNRRLTCVQFTKQGCQSRWFQPFWPYRLSAMCPMSKTSAKGMIEIITI